MKVKEIIEFLKEQDPAGEVVICDVGAIENIHLYSRKRDVSVIRKGMPSQACLNLHHKYGEHILCITEKQSYSPFKEPKDD